MSDELDSLDEREKAAVEAALDRCRALAGQIEIKLHNMSPKHFANKVSRADFRASLERAAYSHRQADSQLTTHLLPA
jgi:hypothetical protein